MNYTLPSNQELAAVVPYYSPHGDSTQLFLTNGEIMTLPLKTATIVRRLAYRQTIDLLALKAKTTKIIQSTIWQPLVLAPDLVLTPLKMRKPKISGDATGGYINFQHILAVNALPNATQLQLTGDHSILCLWKLSTVQSHLQEAQLLFLTEASQPIYPLADLQDKLFRMWFENPSNNFTKFLRLYTMNGI